MTALKLMFIAALLVSGVISDRSKEKEEQDKSTSKEEEEPDQGDTKQQEGQDKGNNKHEQSATKQSVESTKIGEEPSFGDQVLAFIKNAIKRIVEALQSLGK